MSKPKTESSPFANLALHQIPEAVSSVPLKFSVQCPFCEQKHDKECTEMWVAPAEPFPTPDTTYILTFICKLCQAPARYVMDFNTPEHALDRHKRWDRWVKQEILNERFQNTRKNSRIVFGK